MTREPDPPQGWIAPPPPEPPPEPPPFGIAPHGRNATSTEQLHREGSRLAESDGHDRGTDAADRRARATELRTLADPGRRPWFRELSSLLAVTALTLSIGTTAVSYVRTAQQDSHDRRLELTDLVQRMNAITRDAVSVQVTYADNPAALTVLVRTLAQERLLLAKQAARLMDVIPEQVGAAEYASVAQVLIDASIDDPGLSLLDRAVKSSRDANDLSGSLRTWANRLFAIGRADEAREKFGQALLVFDRFRSDDQGYVASTQFDTQLFWAEAELRDGTCDRAKQHAADARSYVPRLPPKDARVVQLSALELQIGTCTPVPSPSPSLAS